MVIFGESEDVGNLGVFLKKLKQFESMVCNIILFDRGPFFCMFFRAY